MNDWLHCVTRKESRLCLAQIKKLQKEVTCSCGCIVSLIFFKDSLKLFTPRCHAFLFPDIHQSKPFNVPSKVFWGLNFVYWQLHKITCLLLDTFNSRNLKCCQTHIPRRRFFQAFANRLRHSYHSFWNEFNHSELRRRRSCNGNKFGGIEKPSVVGKIDSN